MLFYCITCGTLKKFLQKNLNKSSGADDQDKSKDKDEYEYED